MEVVKLWQTTEYLVDMPKYTLRVDKVKEISKKHIRTLEEV